MTSRVQPKEHFYAAALDYCLQHRAIRNLRDSLKPCTNYERGDPSIGDNGVPPCWTVDNSDDEPCDSCKARKESVHDYKVKLSKRAAAKRRMLRWGEKLGDFDCGVVASSHWLEHLKADVMEEAFLMRGVYPIASQPKKGGE